MELQTVVHVEIFYFYLIDNLDSERAEEDRDHQQEVKLQTV